MYNTTEYYKSAIMQSNPSYLTGTIKFKDGSTRTFDSTDIIFSGASITMESVTQDVLEFGAAVLGQLDISIRVDTDESRYKYYDAQIDLYFHIATDNGEETIPLGIWTVSEAERYKTALKLYAYDNLFKFDKKYSLTLVGTPYELITILADDCECELAQDESYFKSLPNGNATLTLSADSSCNTYRQAISIIAQMCGCFVQADRFGKIVLKQFSTSPTSTLLKSQRYNSTLADYMCNYISLDVTGLGGSYNSVVETDETGLTMYIDDAPAWDEGTDDTLQAKTDNLLDYLKDIRYTPCDIVIISDPTIDCGDLITLETDDGSINTLITSYTWKFHSQMELKSVGKNPHLIGTSATKQRIFRDIEKNGGGGSGSSVLYIFKNTKKFICTSKLEPIADVTFVASKDTFVLFNATMQVNVEVDDIVEKSSFTVLDSNGSSKTYEVPFTRDGKVNITIQYYYNSNELGLPYVITLEKGSHVITLHYPIDNVAGNTIDRFAVYMSADNGKVTIQPTEFTGTISGQGLAGSPKWDGTITFEEDFSHCPSTVNVNYRDDYDDIMNVAKRNPNTSSFAVEFNAPSIIGINTLEFNDSLSMEKVVTNSTINPNDPAISDYEFDNRYLRSDGSFRLNTEYTYNSSEITIDSGRLFSLAIRTDDKKTVEGVVINEQFNK